MDTLSSLLQTVLDHPDDLATRRVYADALLASGDPRGELINIQCELATASDPALLRREGELLRAHEKDWLAPWKGAVWHPRLRRGFLEDVLANSKKFMPAAPAILDREPVTSLHVRGLSQASVIALSKIAGIARLETLRLVESSLGAAAVDALFPRLANVRTLNLYQTGFRDDGLAALARLPRLRAVDLSGTGITYDGLETLLGNTDLASLERLSLRWLAPGTDGAGFVAEHLALPGLTHLDVGCSHYSDGDVRHLAGNAVFRRLRALRLEQNEITDGAVAALAPLTKLEVLDLSTNAIGLPGVTALAGLAIPLRSLRLYQTAVDDEQLVALAKAKFPLQHLDLGYGEISEVGIRAIGKAGWPLETLKLWACKIRDTGAHALADADFTATLRELTVGYNDLTDVGVLALASGNWSRLERIVFRGDAIGEPAARALGVTTRMPSLRSVKFEDIKLPKKALAPLVLRGIRIE